MSTATKPLGKLAVNERGDGFTLDGRPWTWLADTCWSAFTSISLADWDYYLARRAEQGFNAVQINTLPQWDRCRPDLGVYPYASEDGTVFDWARPNPAYWERAREMCRMAAGRGIRPALVLMWCNFVPGTWGAAIAERTGAPLMPVEEACAHVRRVVAELGEFDPVYIVTGDTDFKSEETVAYYEQVLAACVEAAPVNLRTMHINRANRSLPMQYVDRLDFYLFQPGHNYVGQDEAWKLPEDYRANYPQKPLINSEPCYEQMGASRNVYWRFTAQDCRASAWSSILAGASAGMTYGAHGIWNWQTSTSEGSALGEGFDAPFRWQECLQFPGAWDFGLSMRVLAQLTEDGALAVEPAQELLANKGREAVRVARVGQRVVAYLPRTTALVLNGALEGYRAVAFDWEEKHVANLPVTVDAAADAGAGTTRVAQHPFTHDALVVLEPAA